MGENEYKVSLGVDIDVGDLQSQIDKAGDKVTPIPIKVEIENLAEIKKQLQSLGKSDKNALTLDTTSLENSLRDVKGIIADIKTSIGTLDSKSGMKSLLSSINSISTALDKASGKFDELNAELKSLSGKDFNINFGINMGGSNPIARNTAYGQKVRGETLPELKKQLKAFEDYFREYYKGTRYLATKNSNPFSGLLASTNVLEKNNVDIIQLLGDMNDPSNLGRQMQAYKQYISVIKEAASFKGIDISHITSQFSKSADTLVQDAVDVQTGAKEMEDGFEKLKQIFGGGNNFNVEGLSEQLDSIVTDLREIKNAFTDLSAETPLNQLKTSFDTLSGSITQLLQNCDVIKTTFSEVGNAGNVAAQQASSGFANVQNEVAELTATVSNAEGATEAMEKALKHLGVNPTGIENVTKDIEEMNLEVKKITTTVNGTNLEMSIQGVQKTADGLERVVTVTKQYKDAVTNTENINRTMSQTFETSADIAKRVQQQNAKTVKDINKEMANFVKLQSQIGNMETKIKNLKLAGGNNNQITELERQLEKLKNTYNDVWQKLSKKLDANIDIMPDEDMARFEDEIVAATEKAKNSLRELDAKYADTRAKLANKIEIELESGKFTTEVQKVNTDAKNLSKVTDELQFKLDILNDAESAMNKAFRDGSVEERIATYNKYKFALESVENQLNQNKIAEQNSINKAALEQSRDKLSLDMSNWLKDNSAAAKDFGGRIKELQVQLQSCDKTTLARLRAEFANIKKEAQLAGKNTQTFGDRLKAQFAKYSSYFSVASIFMYASQGLRDMFNQVVAIDTAMTELKKVTDETDASYNKFLSNAAKRSKELGTTIDGLVASTADFARLGYGFEDAQGLAEVANIYAVVGDEISSVEDATKSLISTLAAYKDEVSGVSDTDFAMDIVDKFNEVSNNFAISSGGIGEALERSASSLNAANNTLDESIALITAANTVVVLCHAA